MAISLKAVAPTTQASVGKVVLEVREMAEPELLAVDLELPWRHRAVVSPGARSRLAPVARSGRASTAQVAGDRVGDESLQSRLGNGRASTCSP